MAGAHNYDTVPFYVLRISTAAQYFCLGNRYDTLSYLVCFTNNNLFLMILFNSESIWAVYTLSNISCPVLLRLILKYVLPGSPFKSANSKPVEKYGLSTAGHSY